MKGFRVGDKVEGLYKNEWHGATIRKLNDDGVTATIGWDDGKVSDWKLFSTLRKPNPDYQVPEGDDTHTEQQTNTTVEQYIYMNHVPTAFKAGHKVEGQYKGTWYGLG